MGIRMGQPGRGEARSSPTEFIGRVRRTRGTETSKYPEEKETRVIPPVAASERGGAQTAGAQKAAAVVLAGLKEGAGGLCRDPVRREWSSRSALEGAAAGGESPVGEGRDRGRAPILSKPGHEKSRLKRAGPSAKAKYDPVTDSERVP